MSTSGSELERRIAEGIARIGERSTDDVLAARDRDLAQALAVDSMLLIEVVAWLEKEFKIYVPDTEFPKLKTLAGFVAFVEGQLSNRTSS